MSKDIACPDCGSVFGGDVYSADPARRRYFAIIRESWQNLPDHLTQAFPSSEHLRKWCLVKAGWCEVQLITVKTGSKEIAAAMRKLNSFAVVSIHGDIDCDVIRIAVAKSQTRRAQPKKQFMECAQKVYDILSEILGTDVEQAA